jgi:tetratricopeptide (TPR) repeat protein
VDGRRAADRIGVRGVWLGIGAAVLAAGLVGLYVNRTFRTGRWALTPDPDATGGVLPRAPAAPAEPHPEPRFPATEDRASYQKGRRLLAAGDAKAALAPLSDAVRALPNDAAAAHEYGLALVQSGEHDRGLFQLEKAARLAPGISSYRVDLARALAAAGRRGQAQRELDALLQRDPANAAAVEARAALGGPAATDASPAPGDGVDLGGAAREPTPAGAATGAEPPRPAAGTAFTNDDLAKRRSGPPAPRTSPAASPRPEG